MEIEDATIHQPPTTNHQPPITGSKVEVEVERLLTNHQPLITRSKVEACPSRFFRDPEQKGVEVDIEA